MSFSSSTTRKWLVLFAAVLAGVVTTSMGMWQLRRAADKEAVITARQAMQAMAPLDLSAMGGPSDSEANRQGMIYRKVTLQGQWLNQYTVYLDNRQMRGRPGFYVVTPFKLADSSAVVLVQRGWVALDAHKHDRVPEIQTPMQALRIEGVLAPWPSRMFELDGSGSGQIRQNLDLAAYRLETGLPLLEISVQQSAPPDDALLREWPQPASGVEKHHGYAFQWFGLTALIAFLYVWFQIVKPRRKQFAG